jgi:hypothetical protein
MCVHVSRGIETVLTCAGKLDSDTISRGGRNSDCSGEEVSLTIAVPAGAVCVCYTSLITCARFPQRKTMHAAAIPVGLKIVLQIVAAHHFRCFYDANPCRHVVHDL